MMTVSMQTRITITFLLLVGATAISWITGHGFLVSDKRMAGVVVLAVAFVKIRYIFLEFMEVRRAPSWLRIAAETWVGLVCSALIWVYWLGADPNSAMTWPHIPGL
jgi:heme/copper-type cytochrome/quinol oxidase subunit 4